MKHFLKTLIRLLFSFPIIARNVFYEYWFKPRVADGDEVLEGLSARGYHVFSEPINPAQVEKLSKDFASLREANLVAETGQLAGRIHSHGAVSELAKIYIDRFKPMAESYFASPKIRCELTMYQHSWVMPSSSDVPGGDFHVDDNKRNLKFFIYLTDVDRDSGPFAYVPCTHGFKSGKTLLRWWMWEVFRKRHYLYGYRLNQAELELAAVPIAGPKGTVFCADTTGYHKALPVVEGVRDVFVVSFAREVLSFT